MKEDPDVLNSNLHKPKHILRKIHDFHQQQFQETVCVIYIFYIFSKVYKPMIYHSYIPNYIIFGKNGNPNSFPKLI